MRQRADRLNHKLKTVVFERLMMACLLASDCFLGMRVIEALPQGGLNPSCMSLAHHELESTTATVIVALFGIVKTKCH